MIGPSDLLICELPIGGVAHFEDYSKKELEEFKTFLQKYYASTAEVNSDLLLVRVNKFQDFFTYPNIATKEIIEFYMQIGEANLSLYVNSLGHFQFLLFGLINNTLNIKNKNHE